MDFRPVGRAAAGEVGDEEAVAPDRILIFQAGVGEVDQRSELARRSVPAVADQELGVGRELLRLHRVIAPDGARHLKALEVERAARAHVDEAGEARLDEVGGGGLEGLDRADAARREVLQGDGAALGGEYLAAVIRGRVEGLVEAAQQHRAGLAALAQHLDAGNARGGVGDRDVRQLADILGDDRVDLLRRGPLYVLRGLKAAPEAGDDDALLRRRGGRIGGLRRRAFRRGLRLAGITRSCRRRRSRLSGGGGSRGRRGERKADDGRGAQHECLDAHRRTSPKFQGSLTEPSGL